MSSLATILALGSLLAGPPTTAAGVSPILWQDEQPPAAGTAPAEPAKPEEQPSEQTASPPEPPADSSEDKCTAKPDTKTEQPAPQTEPPPSAAKKPAQSKTRKPAISKTPVSPQTNPKKKVVRNGSTADPTVELAPRLSQKQENEEVQSTQRLLDATDANLKKIAGKQLGDKQKDMLRQIHVYLQQAKKATADGDVAGAHNLALKAQLLSQELASD